jgi:predicted RNA binding protein YcfA (HicA-like mRNA interferase family)
LKLPRDLSGQELARLLQRLGYNVTRQTGSHIRLTMAGEKAHHVTIPGHATLKVGTLNAILKDVAAHLGTGKDELLKRLSDSDG